VFVHLSLEQKRPTMASLVPTNAISCFGRATDRAVIIFCGALLIGLGLNAGTAAAKHRAPVASSSDPCAAPEAYLRDRVGKRPGLKASLNPNTSKPPATVAEWFNGNADNSAETKRKIADLTQEAEGLNALLKAQGCKTVELSPAPTPSAWSADVKRGN